MDQVRNHGDCGSLSGVTILRADVMDENDTNWRVSAEHRSGATIPSNCKREILAAQVQLGRLYHLLADD
jgi:hypothetical protein